MLKNIWFKRLEESGSHAERLEGFYSGQAHACEPALRRSTAACCCQLPAACLLPARPLGLRVTLPPTCLPPDPPPADDAFRSRFLWGRKPMLAACAARLADSGASDMVRWAWACWPGRRAGRPWEPPAGWPAAALPCKG